MKKKLLAMDYWLLLYIYIAPKIAFVFFTFILCYYSSHSNVEYHNYFEYILQFEIRWRNISC